MNGTDEKREGIVKIEVPAEFAMQRQFLFKGRENFNVIRIPDGVVVDSMTLSGCLLNPLDMEYAEKTDTYIAYFDRSELTENEVCLYRYGGEETVKIFVDIDALASKVNEQIACYEKNNDEKVYDEDEEKKTRNIEYVF